MAHETRTIWVSLWYQDKRVEFEHDLADCPLIIGRQFLKQAFNLRGEHFRNISRNHLEIQYDPSQDQVEAADNSLLGTLARVVGDQLDNLGPEFLYHRDRFLVKRHMRLRLQNEGADREPNDVIIEVENPNHEETRPILEASAYWDRLLSQLRSVRAAQLVGLPGSGKSTLSKKLLATQGSVWQRQRDRHLGGPALVTWIDCRLMGNDERPLWLQLGRRILSALQIAADDQSLFDLRDELRSAVNYFDANVTQRVGQMNAPFRQALRAINRHNLRPVFVFDHFDNAFVQLDKFMLYQLYQFHQWPEVGEVLRYVLVTRRPLDQLRADCRDDGINEFYTLFSRYVIQMGTVGEDAFRYLWREVAPEFAFVSAETLQSLYKLSGGHPGLTRELYEELAINRWIDAAPETWSDWLQQVDWRLRPSQNCVAIWESLDSAEQRALVNHLNGDLVSTRTYERLRSSGLINTQNQLFSPIFTQLLARDRTPQAAPAPNALDINVAERRVYVYGEDVTARLAGRKLDVLLYLYTHANQVCDYNELIQHSLDTETDIDELFLEAERGSLQRTVSRLCRIVDPKRRLIQNEQGRGYILRI